MKLLLPLFLILSLGACTSEELPLYETYGEAFSDEGAIPVQAILAEEAQYSGKWVKMEGTIAAVCQMEGCWLTLRADRNNTVRILVPRTQDGNYVYTVPTDISGRRAVVYGMLAKVSLPDAMAEHHAEEGYLDDQQLQMTARGVLVSL